MSSDQTRRLRAAFLKSVGADGETRDAVTEWMEDKGSIVVFLAVAAIVIFGVISLIIYLVNPT